MKNGRTLLKYILYAVALAVLAEFMMTLDYHSLLGAHGNSNQQLTLSMKDAELVNCEIKDGKVTAAGLPGAPMSGGLSQECHSYGEWQVCNRSGKMYQMRQMYGSLSI